MKNPNVIADTYKCYSMNDIDKNDEKFQHWVFERVTERKIISDLLLLLQMCESETFEITDRQPNIFRLRKKIEVSHLTPLALDNILN